MPNGPYDCPSLVAPWSQQLSSCTPSSKDTPTNIYRNSWTRHSLRSRVSCDRARAFKTLNVELHPLANQTGAYPPTALISPSTHANAPCGLDDLIPMTESWEPTPNIMVWARCVSQPPCLSRVWGVIRTAMSDLHRAFLRAQQELLGGHKRGRHLIALLLSPPALYMLVSKCLYARDRLPENECMYILQ